ncbi:MAG: histidine triad nucleotide-binding protein [Deltaproteobacteria bacterium]|nr:histidine triad nucleotide-binding protein [Deltaproteobacteria bacterium]MBI2500331.1 histidine triad nucleotide-binding protein [Deltaproteobacteria bacterium]MBI4197108.1 histidine triad nucleotide-binding protein [Deltaproteobacteria bacterium]
MSADCLFCKIIRKEIKGEFLHEDDQCVVLKDINPKAPTHLLIVPRSHLRKIADMSAEDKLLVGHLHWVAKQLAKKMGLTDFRIVINNGEQAGQSVWHLHLHFLAGRPLQWPPG